jgi:hypothetical protein
MARIAIITLPCVVQNKFKKYFRSFLYLIDNLSLFACCQTCERFPELGPAGCLDLRQSLPVNRSISSIPSAQLEVDEINDPGLPRPGILIGGNNLFADGPNRLGFLVSEEPPRASRTSAARDPRASD